jgi:transketolase
MSTIAESIEQSSINTIRTLAMDAVEAANSGHPGTPMALAPVAYQLWTQQLRYDPAAPHWPNRDRYVLSCGHASMLLYALIHLAGICEVTENGEVTMEPALSLDDLRRFRQWGSRTPGHPEAKHTTGVETTTGPLGQGCGNSVGMAIAGRWLAARYNRPNFPLFDYRVWVQCSDGDLMEGGASRARQRHWPDTCDSTTCAGFTTTIKSRLKAPRSWRSVRTWPHDSVVWVGTCWPLTTRMTWGRWTLPSAKC